MCGPERSQSMASLVGISDVFCLMTSDQKVHGLTMTDLPNLGEAESAGSKRQLQSDMGFGNVSEHRVIYRRVARFSTLMFHNLGIVAQSPRQKVWSSFHAGTAITMSRLLQQSLLH